MVNKITGKRLKNLISYDWLKMLALSVIVCIVVILIFNAFAKKPSDGQDFRLVIDQDVIVEEDEIKGVFDTLFDGGVEEGGFSYETLQGQVVYLRGNDESPKSYILGGVYAELNQDDVNILLEDVYLEYIAQNNAVKIDEYLISAKQFLLDNGLCNSLGEFDVNRVNSYFETTRGKDTRFKTAEQIKKGKEDELKRLKAIWNNATALQKCFEEHPELLDERTYLFGAYENTGKFAINLSKLNGNSESGKYIENLFKRSYVKDDQTLYTVEGIYLTVGQTSDADGDLFYEKLAFLYTLIKTYSTFI
ncbi:MAG: hypothetical protein IKA54_06220 [Clostridia bacterium]|nr:hypothetical protein [Clostridia bacterium]